MKKNIGKTIGIVLLITLCILISFYIIYKLSNSLLMVIIGALILLIGSLVKDPELSNIEEEKESKLEQLTAFSEEVLEPSIVEEKKSIKKEKNITATTVKKNKKKNNTVLDIENTNSYKFDEVDKKIKKSKKVKA